MKKLFVIIAAISLAATYVSPAKAALETGDKVTVTYGSPKGTTGGGPFALKKVGTDEISESFCIEVGEFIIPNGSKQYHVEMTDAAFAGGEVGVTGSNVISLATAMIFSDWLDDTLQTGLDVTLASTSDAVQRAIWYLEGEKDWSDLGASAKALVQKYYSGTGYSNDTSGGALTFSGAFAGANNSAVSSIKVAQLWEWDGSKVTNFAQDQLVRVPEPAAVAVWSALGLVGLALVRRRKRREES